MNEDKIRIKVCGMTRLQDALFAVQCGVDALGFIFHRKSARYIDPEEARVIIEQLPPFVDVVGVFVDKEREEVEEIVRYCRLGYVQLHGDESPKYAERLLRFASPCEVIKAFRVGDHTTSEDFDPYVPHVKAFLLDTFDKELAGGTGQTFDWSIISRLGLRKPCILAGGLDPENITAALQVVRPYGVDVNSGVEVAPGIKDHRQIREFVRAVREFDDLDISGQI
ncbi:MAG: phosphoribosylanthranilate isomerase [Desulfobulbaceae bacterium]|nr:phosphoribosylanthranilate isomerase [Desulfobulbaceae bacterium]